jgi:acetylornithine deacetylase
MSLDPVEILQRLIRTPSVNPMGRDVSGPHYGESHLTDLLVEICQEHGWRWSRRRIHPERDNLVVLVEGNPKPHEGGEFLLWDVHQDTVPVDGMSIDPFAAELLDGRVYGRGACDVKGSMAAMLAALSRLPKVASAARPTIVLACTVNEECGHTGARSLSQMWTRPSAAIGNREVVGGTRDDAIPTEEDFFPRPPDMAIVAEPTGLNVVVAHQGVVRWRCHTLGRAAHTSRPDEGVNAIYAMSRVIQAIEQYHHEMSSTSPGHPLCGRPTACVSTIHAGVGINTVPDHATIEIDLRLSPDEHPGAAYERLIQYVRERADIGRCQTIHDAPFMESIGLSGKQNRSFADRLTQVVREFGRSSASIGVPFGTDAAAISATGVPTIVFGPGSIAQAHTADEFIEVGELELATEIFCRIACDGVR